MNAPSCAQCGTRLMDTTTHTDEAEGVLVYTCPSCNLAVVIGERGES